MKYWINTVSKNHVIGGVEGGFTQADHGKNTKLKRLSRGDYIIFYSPRAEYNGGRTLQAFTAIGRINDEKPYQVQMTTDFHPWRRRVQFMDCKEIPVQELINDLSFIKNKKHWGYPFRRGLFEISREDFKRIAAQMNITLLDNPL